MKKYLTPLAATLILASGVANAKTSSNQAVTLCKAHVKSTVEGIKRVQIAKVRSSREHHTITLALSTDSGREKTKCSVSKSDGGLSIID